MKCRYIIAVMALCLTVFVSCRDKDGQVEELCTAKFDSLAGIDRAKNVVMYEMLSKELDDMVSFPPEELYIERDKFDVEVDLMEAYLKSIDYKFLSEKDFEKRLGVVFKYSPRIKIDDLVYVGFGGMEVERQRESSKPYLRVNTTGEEYYLNAVMSRGFMTEAYYLMQLVDYQVEFPSLGFLLDSSLDTMSFLINHGYSEGRDKRIYERIGHYNKYLFNDNKQSFDWLTQNDSLFLNNLLFRSGYVEEPKLVRWAIDRYGFNGDFNEIGDEELAGYFMLFVHSDIKQSLILSPVVRDVMVSYKKETNYKDIIFFMSQARGEYSLIRNLESKEQAQLYAYLIEIVRMITNDSTECVANVWKGTHDEGFLHELSLEFSKHDYYGYKGLKEFWDRVVEYDKNYVQPVG